MGTSITCSGTACKVRWRRTFALQMIGSTTAHIVFMIHMREHFLRSLVHFGLHHVHVCITLTRISILSMYRHILKLRTYHRSSSRRLERFRHTCLRLFQFSANSHVIRLLDLVLFNSLVQCVTAAEQ